MARKHRPISVIFHGPQNITEKGIPEERKRGEIEMAKLLIDVPKGIKAKLNALKKQGYTDSGYIRALLESELATVKPITKKEG